MPALFYSFQTVDVINAFPDCLDILFLRRVIFSVSRLFV